MSSGILQILVPAFILVVSGYLINQLPELRSNPRSILIVLIEIALFASLWTWLSNEASKSCVYRELIEKSSFILLAACLVHFFQLLSSSQKAQLPRQQNSSTGPIISGLTQKGKKNISRIKGNNGLIKDTKQDGDGNLIELSDNSNSDSSQHPRAK